MGDGRFTPFFQFLREKQFIRSLNPAELERVRLQVRQITCSECGAPIDLEHSSECKYCHAPVSFLDSDAVEKAVKLWSAAEDRRHSGATPAALKDAVEHLQFNSPGNTVRSSDGVGDRVLMAGLEQPGTVSGLGVDLVAAGIHAIGHLLDALR
jgi:hypothetical protein